MNNTIKRAVSTESTIGILINTKSGSSTDASMERIVAVLKDIGVPIAKTWCVTSEDLPSTFAEIEASSYNLSSACLYGARSCN
jgi:diphthamide synthase subunit DPH2